MTQSNEQSLQPIIIPAETIPAPEQLSQVPVQAEAASLQPQDYSYWRLPGETPRMYEAVGVPFFKKWMPTTGDIMRRTFGFSAGGMDKGLDRQTQLEKTIFTTKMYEALHLATAVETGILHGINAQENNSATVHITFGAIQLVMNAYPIMVQRYNRLRAMRALGRIAQRTGA